jgi:hypothetical protein
MDGNGAVKRRIMPFGAGMETPCFGKLLVLNEARAFGAMSRTRVLAIALVAIGASVPTPTFSQAIPKSSPACVQPPGEGAKIVPTAIFALKPIQGPRTLANPLNPKDTSPLTVLTLGDSAMWGNGLKPLNKYSHQVAQDVANLTRRTVNFVTYAHSAANLSTDTGLYEPLEPSDKGVPPGDLNASLPTTTQQEACAALNPKSSNAEIVLLDGCINDVSAEAIALPFPFSGATAEEITQRAYRECSDKMQTLLQSTKSDFPKATIIVSNYWRIISDRSSPIGLAVAKSPGGATSAERVMRLDFRNLINTQYKAEQGTGQRFLETEELSDPKAIFQKWSVNSKAFLDTSQRCFEWAVSVVDGKAPMSNGYSATANDDPCSTGAPVKPQLVTSELRVFLATVPDDPHFAYGAGPRKRLWSVPIGPFRHDQMFGRRSALCKTHYQKDWVGRLICRVNPTAHPNVPGAKAFHQSIVGILDVAWKTP